MSTLDYTNAPTSRLRTGDTVLTAAKTVGTQPIAKRFGAFAKTHRRPSATGTEG